MQGNCKLCDKNTDLQNSHLIPRFVFRWLKDTSPGHIRSSENPNVRSQDGKKEYMLCEECEQLFSKWERDFANNIFYPFHSNLEQQDYYNYYDWCLKFCVSVSWRVLTHGLELGIGHLSEKQLNAAREAKEVWGDFLLGKRKNPDRFCQYLVPFDIIERLNLPKPSPFLNRYLLRAIDVNIASNNKLSFVYVKLAHLALFGIIDERYPNHWTGTKIHLRKGVIGRKKLKFPAGIDEYLNHRSNKAASVLANMSETQKEKVEEMIQNNMNDKRKFEIFEALNQDIYLFGDEAFSITQNNRKYNE